MSQEPLSPPADQAAQTADAAPASSWWARLRRRVLRAVVLVLMLPLTVALGIRDWANAQRAQAADALAGAASETAASSDVLAAAVAGKSVIGSGAAIMWGGLTANEWAVLGGATVSLCGWFTQLYFQRRQDARERREHHLRVAVILRESAGNPAASSANPPPKHST